MERRVKGRKGVKERRREGVLGRKEMSSLPHLKNFEFLGPCIIYLIILSLPLQPTQLNPVVKLIVSCGYNVDN